MRLEVETCQRPTEEDRLKLLERENLELRRANEILFKASAFFAAVELEQHIR